MMFDRSADIFIKPAETTPVQYNGPSMTSYPTPPSSSGDSPQPIYFVASPGSNSFSAPDMPHFNVKVQATTDSNMFSINDFDHNEKPHLRFAEQPMNKFRFRYRSEMAGTHGSLCGMNSDKSRKQTYPTVELVNCSERAIIRCSIYQHNVMQDYKPHPHRLIMKRGRDEFDDPHDLVVGPEEGYIGAFHSMGIIHTARKNIVAELVRKKSQLKKEFIARMERKNRELTTKELLEIKGLAEAESKSINLNIVNLRFDAFIVRDGILDPICEPIFSHGINNLKCALTGDLKIVRMDHCTSPAKGGKEIFVLVERVTKKNVKIRFFELDDDEQEVWEGWGKFSELDVHHQYAIVFKTPEYDRNRNITAPVRVYMELVRPSDNARSEWKEFTYVPNNEFKPGAKRARSSLYSSSSYNSSSLGSNEIPATIQTIANTNQSHQRTEQVHNSWNTSNGPILNDEQMEIALNDFGSEEFQELFAVFDKDYTPDLIGNNVRDSPNEISGKLKNCHLVDKSDQELDLSYKQLEKTVRTYPSPRTRPLQGRLIKESHLNAWQRESATIKMEVSPEDVIAADRTYHELKSFIKTKGASARGAVVLQKYFGEMGKTNALHIFIGQNRREEVKFFIQLIIYFQKYDLINTSNSEHLTPLHIAASCCNEEFVTHLIYCQANPCFPDRFGKTALHAAIESMASVKILVKLLSAKCRQELIESTNYEGDTPLFTALEKRHFQAFKILCLNGANINRKHQKNGFTPLRMAIDNQYAEIVEYLLYLPQLDLSQQNDFNNKSPFFAASMKECPKELKEILDKFISERGLKVDDIKQEIEDDSDEDMEDEDIEVKCEVVSSDDLEKLYKNVTSLTPQCLNAVATILDESQKYEHLAELLDLSHLILSGMISSEPSISRNLLIYAIERDNVKVFDIRNFLENLDEHKAVTILDKMAWSQNTI